MGARWMSRPVIPVLVTVALTGCTQRAPEPDAAVTPPAPRSSATTTAPAEPTPTPGSREYVRALLSQPEPDVDEVLALTNGPASWTTGRDSVLVEYWLPVRVDWPGDARAMVVREVDAEGRVLSEWVDRSWRELHDYYAVGTNFVGMPLPYTPGGGPVLVRDGERLELTREQPRTAEPGDVRFGEGWLLDAAARTVAREQVAGCRAGSVRVDDRGRLWCLDGRKTEVAWSDDGSRWQRHRLSDTYFMYCDGGTLGADLEIVGDVVSIGLWRADVSRDRGRTWSDVPLLFRRVGAFDENPYGGEANCTQVAPLVDGRLVISYFDSLVSRDASNTDFGPIAVPRRARFAGVEEGLLTAASQTFDDGRWVSFDGRTWQRLRTRSLVRHLLGR